jgi:hypothetical protein
MVLAFWYMAISFVQNLLKSTISKPLYKAEKQFKIKYLRTRLPASQDL